MQRIDFTKFRERYPRLTRVLLNKYFIVLLVFGIVFVFIGDQSLIYQIRQGHRKRAIEQEIRQSRANIEAYRRELNNMTNRDSLEHFAREQYHMHAPNEDVYVVK